MINTAVWSEDSIPLAELRRLNRVGSMRTLTVAGKTTFLSDRGPVPAEREDCWMSGALDFSLLFNKTKCVPNKRLCTWVLYHV